MLKKLKKNRFGRWSLPALALMLVVLAVFYFTGRAEKVDPGLEVSRPADNCTSIVVGRLASVDGSTMTTHTCDCGLCDWTWRHVPAARHKPGETRKIYHISQFKTWPPTEGLKWDLVKKDFTGLEIPEIPYTYAYHHGMFGYINEKQVAIGESTIGNVRKLDNPTPTPAFDITMLTIIAMERASTAREAIKIMGELAEKYGYGFHDNGEMLAVADPKEVWIFEIIPVGPLWTPQSGKPGAVWCAQRVPDDHVSVCPNESRIGEIDLNNPDYFMASPNVISCAVENGLYDPASGQPFNWKKAYSPLNESATSSSGRYQRLWRFFDLVAPSLKLSPSTPNMDLPFSVKPDRKISVADVINMTRDRSYGTPFDPVKGIRGGPFKNPNYYRQTRTICDSRAEYSTVTQCRDWLPDPIGGIVWISFGSQDTACYMPFYAGVTELPRSFSIGDHWVFNRDSARWAFDYVDFHVQVIYSEAIKDVEQAILKYEKPVIDQIPEIDRKATELYKKNPKEAARFLTGFCLNNAQNVVKAWWDLGDQLLVKYNHLYLYNVEKRTYQRRFPNYPDLWQKAVRAFDVLFESEEKR
ncbi:MAG: Dipeptidase, family C69 [Candidatus Saccharicenans subterraneus]|uniref:Dipeptidase n=1 Tax=Candidatus Saccharicenans subterraneus TaxID=2508984 RepID=A0A3E2BMQ7_9BACT|nr:MAG: Dipeptidase, family C69 [Candidatus Saccharicenans subterraneum]